MSREREVSLQDAMGYARLEARRGRHDRAETVLRQVAAARPDYLPARVELSRVLQRMNRYGEAVSVLQRLTARQPALGKLIFNMANAIRNDGDVDTAITTFRRAVRLDPDSAEMHVGLGLALLQTGAWEEGFAEYEWRRTRQEFEDGMRSAGRPLWDGGDVAGRTIVLLGEQGAGDAIHFVRYAALLADRGATVKVNCHPPLRRLLASATGVHEIVERNLGAFDAADLMMSLPMRFGTRPDSVPAPIPYLRPPTDRPVRLPDTGRPRVGLVWAGNPAHVRDHWRTIGFAELSPVLDVGGVDFYSLQKGAGAQADHSRVTSLGAALHDFADTAAIIDQLDLVIAVDTSVAHLTGALGKPLWLLLARNADWRWLRDREDTPWYPTARLFRQQRLGEWGDVVARVAGELARLA
ncbi:MAG TPA: tetratricopeptide repeat-containing glycosyltransferase family protein [Azospirillum sp.]